MQESRINITPPPSKLIVAVDLQQRSNYMMKYGTLELWMDSSFGEDGKETNPTLAEVVGSADDDYKPGDMVLCHYNTFMAMVNDLYRYGSHEEKDEQGRTLFTIYPHQVRCILDKDGMPHPAKGFILVKRIRKEVKSTLIIPEVAQHHDMLWFEVEKVSDGVEYKQGDMVLCYSKSDMLIKYTFNKQPVECFVVRTDDVHGYIKK